MVRKIDFIKKKGIFMYKFSKIPIYQTIARAIFLCMHKESNSIREIHIELVTPT